MAVTYTKDEVKNIVHSGNVNTSNLTDIITSLLDYDFDNEIREIFVSLKDNENLPEAIRTNLGNVVESYDEIQNRGSILSDNKIDTSSNKSDEVIAEPIFVEPEISVINSEEREDSSYQELPSTNETISLENDAVLGGITAYAFYQGVKVVSSNPGLKGLPSISFELDEVSKPYVDNLLLQLYSKQDSTLDVSLNRIESTKKEVLTISLDGNNLSVEDVRKNGIDMFKTVDSIMRDTDKNKDYEAKMPNELKRLKDKFVNDDPNIPDDNFKVGYLNENGQNSFYLVTDSKVKAIELAELMGYEVKKDRGGNVFELDTTGKEMEGTKLDRTTVNINDIDEVKDTDNGISDVDIYYNNKHYDDDNSLKVVEFLEREKDPSNMAIVQVDIPASTKEQRVVSLASEDGTRDTIIFSEGKDFDNYVLPKIATAFGQGATVSKENITKVSFENGTASYEAISSDNNYFRMNNYDDVIIDRVDGYLSKYAPKEESVTTTKNNNYQKTLGTYPTNSNLEAAKTSFATIIGFIVIALIGFLLLYMMY